MLQLNKCLPACRHVLMLPLFQKWQTGDKIKGAIVDGPLALDVAIDKESAQIRSWVAEWLAMPIVSFFRTLKQVCFL
jgi:hypothetical protein